MSPEEYYAHLFNSCDHDWKPTATEIGCTKCGMMGRPDGAGGMDYSVPVHLHYENVIRQVPGK